MKYSEKEREKDRTFDDLLPDLDTRRLPEDSVGVDGISVRNSEAPTDPAGEDVAVAAASETLQPAAGPPGGNPSSPIALGTWTQRFNPIAFFAFLHKLPILSLPLRLPSPRESRAEQYQDPTFPLRPHSPVRKDQILESGFGNLFSFTRIRRGKWCI
ncbi:hypothetical protein B296_00008260 [Ensete ventricosum]|uniref:Uncharacterized protein n=1 Tax=Ensete ventricosum TaxID=4639 RepID=A0A426YUZ8_ENSVE|nr:hypothetical protein B296_00008260 [Ensete ventricosum]